jgi:hypothetical protein
MNIRYFDEAIEKIKELRENFPLKAIFFAKMRIIVKWYKGFCLVRVKEFK